MTKQEPSAISFSHTDRNKGEKMVGAVKRGALMVAVSMVIVMMVANLQVSRAAVYKVGDSTGWTTIGHYDYKTWAATKTFHLGDIILYEYNTQFHNVMQVKHREYKSCNVSTPIATHTTGNDTITITKRGHHFFLCGVPGHCQSGQKVDIHVPRLLTTAPSPSSSRELPTTSNSTATVQGPTASHAYSICFGKVLWTTVGAPVISFLVFWF